MACRHKFYDELQLKHLDYEPTTLIVGTFNPEWPEGNYAEWFYGRTDNNYFWDLLPRIYGEPGLRESEPKVWKQFCKTKRVALTDLISEIRDADVNNERHRKILGEYTDTAIASKFKAQIPNSITSILQANRAIKTVYLTTTNGSAFWQKLWQPVVQYCAEQNIICNKLMTPSKGARFQMTRGSGISMPDFIYSDWSKKWHSIQ